MSTGKETATFKGHEGSVDTVAFSGDGQLLASGSADHTVKLWGVAKGQEVATLKGHTDKVSSVAFSGDGKLLASASADGTVKLWATPGAKKVDR